MNKNIFATLNGLIDYDVLDLSTQTLEHISIWWQDNERVHG